MINKGTVALIDKYGDEIFRWKYHTPARRKVIIENIKNIYKRGLEGCCIHICPDTDDLLIGENGLNLVKSQRGTIRDLNGKYVNALSFGNNLEHSKTGALLKSLYKPQLKVKHTRK